MKITEWKPVPPFHKLTWLSLHFRSITSTSHCPRMRDVRQPLFWKRQRVISASTCHSSTNQRRLFWQPSKWRRADDVWFLIIARTWTDCSSQTRPTFQRSYSRKHPSACPNDPSLNRQTNTSPDKPSVCAWLFHWSAVCRRSRTVVGRRPMSFAHAQRSSSWK